MRAYILYRNMEEQNQHYSAELESRGKSLVDYISSNCILAEHLDIVAEFLQNRYNFMEMLTHAKTLREAKPTYGQIDVGSLIAGFNENEVGVIGEYMRAVGDYVAGKGNFESVDELASKLIRLIPIPDTARIPKDSEFHKGEPGTTLADMREEV